MQVAKMSFLFRVAGLTLRVKVQSSDIRKELSVKLLLLYIEKRQPWWFGLFTRMVILVCPTGRRQWARARTYWMDYMCNMARSSLGILQGELEKIAGERDIWTH